MYNWRFFPLYESSCCFRILFFLLKLPQSVQLNGKNLGEEGGSYCSYWPIIHRLSSIRIGGLCHFSTSLSGYQSCLIRFDCGLQTSGVDELSNPNSDFAAEQEEPKDHGMLLTLHEYPLLSIIILYFCIITFDLIIMGTGLSILMFLHD